MSATRIPQGIVLTAEHLAFYEAAKNFVTASYTDRSSVKGARRKMERAFSDMKRSEQAQQVQTEAA